jgi:hypothetical protein
MPEPPLVLVTEGSDPTPLAWLREQARVVEAAPGSPKFDSALPGAAGMVVRTYTRVDAALLARGPKLKVVGRGGVGLENIDVPACRARGVEVVYTPDADWAGADTLTYVVTTLASITLTPTLSSKLLTALKSPTTHHLPPPRPRLQVMRLFHSTLLELISHLEYTFTTKYIVFKSPHSKQTPTNPSPMKEKMRELLDVLQIERIPPLLPSDGKKTQSQSHDPHNP